MSQNCGPSLVFVVSKSRNILPIGLDEVLLVDQKGKNESRISILSEILTFVVVKQA